MYYRNVLRSAGILALASGALIAPKALAANPDQAAAAPASQDTVTLAPLVITGSNIPTSADTTDVPVTIVSSQNIEDTGDNANLLDILRKQIPAFGGRSSTGNANATNAN